jgi:hypothetical protein
LGAAILQENLKLIFMKKKLFTLIVACIGYVAVNSAAEVTLSCGRVIYAPTFVDYYYSDEDISWEEAWDLFEEDIDFYEEYYCS